LKYCLDANAIINIQLVGMLSDLEQMAAQNLICIPEGVYRELTDTTTKIGEKIKKWVPYGCIHDLTPDELLLLKEIDGKYGQPFKIGNGNLYGGFWATPSGEKGVDAQVVVVAKLNNLIIVTNDGSMHGASYFEDVECIRFEELCRRFRTETHKLL